AAEGREARGGGALRGHVRKGVEGPEGPEGAGRERHLERLPEPHGLCRVPGEVVQRPRKGRHQDRHVQEEVAFSGRYEVRASAPFGAPAPALSRTRRRTLS